MNNLILQFPKILPKIKDIGIYTFDVELDQISQTEDFVKKLGLDRSGLSGICFERKKYI